VRFGLNTARAFHIGMLAALLGVGWLLLLGWPFYLGLAITAGLLAWEHSLVKPDDLSKINLAFFNINGYIAIVLFVTTLASLYV
jgi:4-hydroxybenzoate polyprenyltransferase